LFDGKGLPIYGTISRPTERVTGIPLLAKRAEGMRSQALQICSLNLRHGGGKRCGKILSYLGTLKVDLLILTEYRSGPPGLALCEGLRELGYSHFHAPDLPPKTNSVLIASKALLEPLELNPPAVDRQRIVGARVAGLTVFGVYFAIGKSKASLFDYILSNSEQWLKEPALLMGDFNSGLHKIDEDKSTFHCADLFAQLSQVGWQDAWRAMHGETAKEASWISQAGNGFRLDHAFVSTPLMKGVMSCEYDHETRKTITDHSAMLLEV